jgi:hypothetical protein
VVKQKVARKKFPRRKETFSLRTVRKPLTVSVEKFAGHGKLGGQRFRRQLIQHKQPLQENNVSFRVMLKKCDAIDSSEIARQKFVNEMPVFIKENVVHMQNQIQRRSRHVAPPLSLRAPLHLTDKMKNLPVQM